MASLVLTLLIHVLITTNVVRCVPIDVQGVSDEVTSQPVNFKFVRPVNRPKFFPSYMNDLQNNEFCLLSCAERNPDYHRVLASGDYIMEELRSLNLLDDAFIKWCKNAYFDKITFMLSRGYFEYRDDVEQLIQDETAPYRLLIEELKAIKYLRKLSFKDSLEFIKNYRSVTDALVYMSWNADPNLDIWFRLNENKKRDASNRVMMWIFGLKNSGGELYRVHEYRGSVEVASVIIRELHRVRGDVDVLRGISGKSLEFIDMLFYMSIQRLPWPRSLDHYKLYNDLAAKVEKTNPNYKREILDMVNYLRSKRYSEKSLVEVEISASV